MRCSRSFRKTKTLAQRVIAPFALPTRHRQLAPGEHKVTVLRRAGAGVGRRAALWRCVLRKHRSAAALGLYGDWRSRKRGLPRRVVVQEHRRALADHRRVPRTVAEDRPALYGKTPAARLGARARAVYDAAVFCSAQLTLNHRFFPTLTPPLPLISPVTLKIFLRPVASKRGCRRAAPAFGTDKRRVPVPAERSLLMWCE